MPRKYSLTVLMAVAATVLFYSTATAQHCASCSGGGGGGGFVDAGYANTGFAAAPYAGIHGGGFNDAGFVGGGAGCDSCGDATTGFDYPGTSGGCGAGGCGGGGGFGGGFGGGAIGGHRANCQAWKAHVKEVNRISTARNGAWPKPFRCADRQLYFEIWRPMLQAGVNANCLLSDNHFDINTGELNAAGKTRLRSIAQNNPVGHKAVLVQNTGDQIVNNQRLNYVQQVVNDWYSGTGFSQVAISNSYPVRGAGARIETINRLGSEGIAPPIIPVASGTGSTQQSNN